MKTVFCSTRNILMEETKSGAKMVCASNMLTKGEGGKIHVVHNKNDPPLLILGVLDFEGKVFLLMAMVLVSTILTRCTQK